MQESLEKDGSRTDVDSEEPGVRGDRPKRSLTWVVAVGAIVFLYAMSLGSYMCLVSLTGIMNADLGPSEAYTWIAPAWTVAAGTGIIVAGSLSDLVGRRWFCISTGLLGMLAGIVGGVAQNIPSVIAAFAIMGLNQAGAMNSFAAAAELVSRKHRGYLAAIMNMAATLWVVAGSYFGRRMTTDTAQSWRSAFWLTLACNGAGALVVALTYYPRKPLAVVHGYSYKSWAEFDWIGLFGTIVGPTLFLVGILNIPNYGAKDAHFLGPFISGTICIFAVGIYEAFFAPKPLLHPFLFRQIRTFSAILVVAFVGGMLFYSLQAWFPLYLEMVYGEDAIQVGIDTMPMNAGTNIGGLMISFLLPTLGPRVGTTAMLTTGVILQFIFIPLMCVPGIHSRGMALGFSALGGVGIGIVELLTILLIQLATPDDWIGFATGALGLLRSMGGSIGTAIYSTIVLSKSSELVPEYVYKAATKAGLPDAYIPELIEVLTGATAESSLATIPGLTPEILHVSRDALKEAYRSSFRYIWLTSIAFAVLSLACSLATKDLSSHLTNDVAQGLQSRQPEKDEEAPSVQHVEKANDFGRCERYNQS